MLDVWDLLGLVGVGLILGGAYVWHPPSAFIIAGCGLVGLYYLRESRRDSESPARAEKAE